ncbi:MAG: glycosyl transferase family 1 [Candidatus Rokubacteria bacterium RIFCSPLOWO2_02_FULL_73_56]|nr:MAG: glycosyl transferase family 1 [Candidatus Rokubacteria bacterium RIFCSPLOWO2_02_FULL_73_56]
MAAPRPRVALVHDWLTGMRGGERCLEVACELFPEAPLYTLLWVPGSVSPLIERRRIVTSFVGRLPRAATRYRAYLPLFPAAIRRLDLGGHDLILSLSHCVAKGVRTPPGALHLCYCFTPMRYVWDLYDDYFGARAGLATRLLMPPVAAALRRWDRRTAGVHRFAAISQHIAERIRRVYGRAADVLHPPVDVQRFRLAEAPGDFYLVVSALAPYKRVDLAVGAANRLGRRLLVVGTGPEERRLRRLAGPTVELLGWRPDPEVAELYARCRAVLFPSHEDYGIVPLEAAAAGRPTIALARGGALETMVGLDAGDEPPTAVFFAEQTVEALAGAIGRFEAAEGRFEPKALRARAERFDRPAFKARLEAWIARAVAQGRAC